MGSTTVKTNRTRSAVATVAVSPSSVLARSAWTNFWFTPTLPIGLHCVRFLAGMLFLAWLLPLAGQLEPLFGAEGWFDREAYLEARHLPNGPPVPLGWSLLH